MSEVMTTVILPVISAAVLGLAGYLGAQIKRIYERYVADQTKKNVAMTVIRAVEQMYKDLHGDDKKLKAIEGIRDMLNEKGIPISELEIEMLLEAAVAEFNRQRTKDAGASINA